MGESNEMFSEAAYSVLAALIIVFFGAAMAFRWLYPKLVAFGGAQGGPAGEALADLCDYAESGAAAYTLDLKKATVVRRDWNLSDFAKNMDKCFPDIPVHPSGCAVFERSLGECVEWGWNGMVAVHHGVCPAGADREKQGLNAYVECGYGECKLERGVTYAIKVASVSPEPKEAHYEENGRSVPDPLPDFCLTAEAS